MASVYVYKIIDGIKYKKCSVCKKYKPATVEFFHKKTQKGKFGVRAECKICRSAGKSIKDYEHFNASGELFCVKCRTYKPIESFTLCSKGPQVKTRKSKSYMCCICGARDNRIRRKKRSSVNNLERHITILINRSRILAKKKNRIFSINKSDLLFLYKKQKGQCAISGIKMDYTIGPGRHLNNISVDRIDSSFGYELHNIQLTCVFVNVMKSDLSTENLIEYCNKITNFAERP